MWRDRPEKKFKVKLYFLYILSRLKKNETWILILKIEVRVIYHINKNYAIHNNSSDFT